MSSNNYENLSEDQLLSISTGEPGEMARFNRIMMKKMSDSILAAKEQLSKLGAIINHTRNSYQEVAERIIASNKNQADAHQRQLGTQNKLTAVIAVATIVYVLVTVVSVFQVMKSNSELSAIQGKSNELLATANELQEQRLEALKTANHLNEKYLDLIAKSNDIQADMYKLEYARGLRESKANRALPPSSNKMKRALRGY